MARLYNYEQAGEYLGGLSQATIRRMVAAGELAPPVVVTRRRASGMPGRVAFAEGDLAAAVSRIIARNRTEQAARERG